LHSSRGEQSETSKSGYSLSGKAVGSWEYSSMYLDAAIGFQWMQLTSSEVKITTRSLTGELEARYKLSSSWSLGPAVKLMGGTDNTNSETVGAQSTNTTVLAKLNYQTMFGSSPARLEFGLGSTVGLSRNMTTALVGFQVALPWSQPKKTSAPITVVTKTYITEELPDLKVDLKVAQVKFNTDKFALTSKDNEKLTRLAKFLTANNAQWSRIKIGGHTDSTGDATYNKALSQDRADSVMKVFILGGVSETKMSAYGYGATRPVDATNSPDAWAKNRRTEIEFFGVKNRNEFNRRLMEILK
jgi:outer membrane protein OmpA-like peptidoglycan-associated protein